MQNIVLIKGQMKNKQLKKLFNFRFIALLSIAALIQHLSFAVEQKSFEVTKLSSGVTQNTFFEKGTTNQQETQLHLILEAESEDEDEVNNEQPISNGLISSNQNFKVAQYSDAIKTLYLRLAFLHQHKVDLPFFILYHSWKSHLA